MATKVAGYNDGGNIIPFESAPHNHGISDINGLGNRLSEIEESLDGKEPKTPSIPSLRLVEGKIEITPGVSNGQSYHVSGVGGMTWNDNLFHVLDSSKQVHASYHNSASPFVINASDIVITIWVVNEGFLNGYLISLDSMFGAQE